MILNKCNARIFRPDITGISFEDIIKITAAFYNKINMNHVRDDCGPPFRHYLVWKVLCNLITYKCAYQNFMAGARECGTKNGIVRGSSPKYSIIKLENGIFSSDKTKSDEKHSEQKIRPKGRKKSKKILRKSKKAEKKIFLACGKAKCFSTRF